MSRARANTGGVACALLALMLAGTGCGKKRPAAEAARIPTFQRAIELLAKHQLRQATTALKNIQFSTETREELEPLTRLALADATFYQGSDIAWIDARNLYTEFVTLNGNHPLAPYAQLQVGLCSLKQVSQPTKDQSLTLQAIRDLETVESRWPDSAYVVAARAMLREARANLAESEFLVGQFYLKKKNYRAAVDRFNGIVVRFPDFPSLEKVLFHLAQAHLEDGDPGLARAYLNRLLTEYPNGEYVSRAQKTLGSMAAGFTGEIGD